MREIAEFRIPEELARRFLPKDVGKNLGGSIRLVKTPVSDPLYERLGQIYRMLRQQENTFLFGGWNLHRYYTHRELDSAALFHLVITSVFEPTGEEVGTLYDDSVACTICGAGRKQVSELVLDLRKTPKNKDIARTLADEWIVSQRLAQLLLDNGMTGFELRPVRHKVQYDDDSIDLMNLKSGQELLRLAESIGCSHPTWKFWVWLNRPEQRAIFQKVKEEYVASQEKLASKRSSRPLPKWYQLIITSKPVSTVSPTRFGIEPFDEDPEGEYRCPRGHISGLALLSDVSVSAAGWDGNDFSRTENLVGDRRGVLVPAPLILISPRLYRLLQIENVKGYKAEVAHLI